MSNLDGRTHPIERGDGELLLTVYHKSRRWGWIGPMRSLWRLEWRKPAQDEGGGEYTWDLAEGWTNPRWGVTTVRCSGRLSDWYPE